MDIQKLQRFEMKYAGNSCYLSGAPIPVGATCYAANADAARNGGAVCEAEYLRLTAAPPADVKKASK